MKNRAFRIMMVTGVLAASMLTTTAYAKTEKKEAATEAAADTDSEADSEVDAAELLGTFKGEKHIDVMNCDITIEITLKDDGTFLFYRAPMKVDMNGGGEMPEQKDEGTYEVDGNEISFKGEEMGEFQVTVKRKDAEAEEAETEDAKAEETEEAVLTLEGKIPTGGPSTDMTLEKQPEEENDSEAEPDKETKAETKTETKAD